MIPLPVTLGDDLNEIKTLIDERIEARQQQQTFISAANDTIRTIDDEIKMLQNHALVKLGAKPDLTEKKAEKTDDAKPAIENTP